MFSCWLLFIHHFSWIIGFILVSIDNKSNTYVQSFVAWKIVFPLCAPCFHFQVQTTLYIAHRITLLLFIQMSYFVVASTNMVFKCCRCPDCNVLFQLRKGVEKDAHVKIRLFSCMVVFFVWDKEIWKGNQNKVKPDCLWPLLIRAS